MNSQGLKIILAGFILLIIDSCYLGYYVIHKKSKIQTEEVDFPRSILTFWHHYLLDSFGGVILLIAAVVFLVGFLVLYRERRKFEKKTKMQVDEFMKKVRERKANK